MLLQLLRVEPLRVGERLPADVIGGHAGAVRVGNFNVVAEDLVVADFEAGNAGSLALAALQPRDVGARVLRRPPRLVHLRRVALADDPALPQLALRIVNDGLPRALHDGVARPQAIRQPCERGARVRRHFAQGGNALQRAAQPGEFPRQRDARPDALHRPLDVRHLREFGANALTARVRLAQPRRRVEPPLNRPQIKQRLPKPAAEHPRPHRRLRKVERAQQRLVFRAPSPALEEFQVPPRLRIQRHISVRRIRPEPRQLRQHGLMRLPQVVEHDRRRRRRQVEPLAAVGVERPRAEVIENAPPRRVRREPRVGRPRHAPRRRVRVNARSVRLRENDLRRRKAREFLRDRSRRQLRDGELPGGDVRERDARLRAARRDGREVVVRARLQHPRLDHRAGRHHPRDLPPDDALAVGLRDLLRDGDAMPLADEFRQIAVERVIGNARERNDLALPHIALRQHDLQVAGGEAGVLVEHLVEVAEAVEEQRVGMTRLDLQVLLANCACHEGDSITAGTDM